MHQLRDHQRPGYVESELVAAQQRLIASALPDLVRNRVQRIIAEIFVEAPVPVAKRIHGRCDFSRTIGAQPQISSLDLEFLDSALDVIGLTRRLLLAVAKQRSHGAHH